jgi:flagellar biosynthetic protein FliP
MSARALRLVGALLPLLGLAGPALGAQDLALVTVEDQAGGSETWSVSLQVMIAMTLLTLLPTVVLTMTSFTRFIVVLAILRQALGTMNTPSNQILIGLSLFLSLFVMMPVLDVVRAEALEPWLDGNLAPQDALETALAPLEAFMLPQTRESDLALFASLAGLDGLASPDDVPLRVLVPAFVTSELKTAFQIGFMLFVPFLIIDLVVASVLMSLGMMMLSPMVISLPFKLMLFVLIDGWALVLGTLAGSFSMPLGAAVVGVGAGS